MFDKLCELIADKYQLDNVQFVESNDFVYLFKGIDNDNEFRVVTVSRDSGNMTIA